MKIVKTCKKHGQLDISQTYDQKTKYGTLIKLCSICKRGYRNDWAKLNPEKVKLSEEKKKAKRLEELKNGTLKKICQVHGDLPINKIRIDARGTRICRLCSNEQKIKSKKKVDPTGEKYKQWLYSDRERVQRYRKNDSPKRRIRQIKAYYRLKENDPIKYKEKEISKLKRAKKARERLDDYYINGILKTIRHGGKNNRFYHYLKGKKFPQEIIDIIKTQIILKRKLRNLNAKAKNNERTSRENASSI